MMFLAAIDKKTLVGLIGLSTMFGLSGCSSLGNKLNLFDKPAPQVEVDEHYDVVETEEVKKEGVVEVKSDEGATVSAGPVVKGLVADIKKRAYEEKAALREPIVVSSLEEDLPDAAEAEKVVADLKKEEPPAPKTKPIAEVKEAEISEKTEPVVAEVKETKKDDIQTVVASKTREIVQKVEAKDDFAAKKEPYIEVVSNATREQPQPVVKKDEVLVSETSDLFDFPGLLPLEEDDFDFELSSYMKPDDFNLDFDFGETNFGHFETIIVDDEIGTMPLSKFNQGDSSISYLATVVYHGHGRSDVDAVNLKEVIRTANLYKKKRSLIRVVGHASSRTANLDPVSHMIANFTMSLERARNVAKALISYGVLPADIYVGAVSDSEPIYYEVMPLGEEKNRRTEIYIEYP